MGEKEEQLDDLVRERLLPTLFHPARRADTRLTRVVAAMADGVGPAAYLRQLAALSTRADSRPHLAQIACPTLLIAGCADAICPVALHEEMAAAIAGARLVVIEVCGHLSSLEQSRAVSELLRGWLGERSKAGDRVMASDEAR
jgi:pimeloyl-ACP methyl ester carboxylesterase